MRHSVAVLLLALGFVTGLPACTTAPERPFNAEEAYPHWMAKTRDALVERGDPASIYAAGLLTQAAWPGITRSDTESHALFKRAAAGARDNVIMSTIFLASCLRVPTCDADGAAAALQGLDPDNAVWRMPGFAAAVRTGDQAEIDRELEQLAQASRFDMYGNPSIILTIDVLKRTGLPASPEPGSTGAAAEWMTTAIGGFVYHSMTIFGSIPDACKGASSGSARREACLAIYRKMARSDTSVVQALGSSLLKRTADPGSADAALADAWRRDFDWSGTQLAEVYRTRDPRKALAEHERAVRENPREDDSLRALLVALGLPPDPPPAWSRPESKRQMP